MPVPVRIDKSLSKQTLTDAHFEIKSTKTCNRRTVFMYTRLINAYLFIQRYLTAAAMLSMFVSQMHIS